MEGESPAYFIVSVFVHWCILISIIENIFAHVY